MNNNVPATPQEAGPKSGQVYEGFCTFGLITSTIVLGLLLVFVALKDANYTSISPWVLSLLFVPTAIVGMRALFRNETRLPAFLECLSGLAGMSYLYYLDHSGRMISYMEMIRRCKTGQ